MAVQFVMRSSVGNDEGLAFLAHVEGAAAHAPLQHVQAEGAHDDVGERVRRMVGGEGARSLPLLDGVEQVAAFHHHDAFNAGIDAVRGFQHPGGEDGHEVLRVLLEEGELAVEHGPHPLHRVRMGFGHGGKALVDVRCEVMQHGHQDLLLALEMAVEGRFGEVHAFGQALGGERCEAILRHQLSGGFDDLQLAGLNVHGKA
ncbi:MAG: hypothetical protein V9G12_12010 [Microthrixaceae bacterium]